MNENINLTKILKDCPRGFKLYSAVHGEVTFLSIEDREEYPIGVLLKDSDCTAYYSSSGKYLHHRGECTLFPSKYQRDWSKFTAPWLKKERFDPKTLKPFDRVLVIISLNSIWNIQYFSYIEEKNCTYPIFCLNNNYAYCIPYNDETKHLVGTTEEAPEFYRYWED